MRVKDYFTVEVDCCLDVGYYTEKCLMDNFKRINSSLSYCNHTGKRLWRPVMIIWDTLVKKGPRPCLEIVSIGRPLQQMLRNILNPVLDVSSLRPSLKRLS